MLITSFFFFYFIRGLFKDFLLSYSRESEPARGTYIVKYALAEKYWPGNAVLFSFLFLHSFPSARRAEEPFATLGWLLRAVLRDEKEIRNSIYEFPPLLLAFIRVHDCRGPFKIHK